ncbi:MAG: protein kinase, partial [Longimicrobiales bacterium]
MLPGDEFCPKCGTRSPDAPTIQSNVSVRRIIADSLAKATAGDFEIIRELGHGAMGAVYLAKDLSLGRRVAIKLIAPALLDNPTMVERFILEAQTVASLKHPNIVNVHSVREFADLHYFVMDYIDGPSLQKVLRNHGPLEVSVVQALLFQVGSALSYAHRRGRGVIHRDVKPANIMLDREGNAFMTDFGISKIAQSKSGLTVTGTTVGTPDYMSPEQCRDEDLTGASDQYSLGIVAYEMLCGSPPFSGSHHVVMFAHTIDAPSPVAELRADCPSEVADAVMRMLAKSPEDRWPDVGHAVEALGGRPLSHSDPVRSSILGLMETGVGMSAGFDTASPLSPIPGADSMDAMPASVSISGLPALIEAGDSFTLLADAHGTAGVTILEPDTLWATSDPSIAIVDGGAVQALAAGPVSITATVGSVANTVILTVEEPSVAQIAVIPSALRMEPGARMPLRAAVEDRRGKRLERDVLWTSDADAIVSVSGKGEVEARALGLATVVAEVDGTFGHASITVEEAEVRAIQLSELPTSVVVGDEFSVVASLTDARGAALDREVTWVSSDPEIAAVEGGMVTAVAVGTVTITARCDEQSAAVDVTVLPQPVASI